MAHRNSWLSCLLLLSAGSFAQQPAQEQPPGNERVCVPGENGRGWVCGTRDHPPQVNSPPPPPRSVPEPPPFLADPSRRTRTSGVPRAQPAQVQPIADRQAAAPEVLPDSAPVATAPVRSGKGSHRNADTHSTPRSETAIAAPAAATTASEPAPARAASSTQAANIDDAPVAIESLPEPTAAPAAPATLAANPATETSMPSAEAAASPAPEPRAPTGSSIATSAEGFAALPDAQFTVQLSRSRSPAALDALVRELKLNPDSTYRLAVSTDGGVEHLLLWSHFDDLGRARAALASLPHAKIKGAWVRKVSELRTLATPAGDAVAATTPAATSATAAAPTPSAAATTEPAPPPMAPAETRAPRSAGGSPAAALGNASDFLRLAPTHFAVQLARAHSSAGFAPLIAALELRDGAAYTIELQLGSRRDYVLLWADFPDLASARAAAARLPANRVSGALPRRIGPLQDELRRATP